MLSLRAPEADRPDNCLTKVGLIEVPGQQIAQLLHDHGGSDVFSNDDVGIVAEALLPLRLRNVSFKITFLVPTLALEFLADWQAVSCCCFCFCS